jgi:outer membrane lipoprotein SlyB
MRTRPMSAFLLLPVLLGACVTTTTRSTTWGDPQGPAERYGRVQTIQEIVERRQGDPGAGAVAGAIIGGVLGSAMGGHAHRDRQGRVHQHASGAGAVGGAVLGAVVGAAASQERSERRFYDVVVQFEDGGVETFRYEGGVPFRAGDALVLGPNGLALE